MTALSYWQRSYVDQLQQAKEWELDRELDRLTTLIRQYSKVQGNDASIDRLKTQRGQVRAELARRRQSTQCFT